MNARQAARAAAKRIEELEYYNLRASADIKAYNAVIDSMIAGGSPCDWCEEKQECQLQVKADGKGCSEWWLANDLPVQDQDGGDASDSENIFSGCTPCGE